jgi:hypothetical protein
MNQFTAVLHAGSPVSCHNILNFLLCFNESSTPGVSYFPPKIVVFLAHNLYSVAREAAKSLAASQASLEE